MNGGLSFGGFTRSSIKQARSSRVGPLTGIQTFNVKEFIELLKQQDPFQSVRPAAPEYLPLPVGVILRAWVDEWLDSGINQDGSEDPQNRNFEMADKVSLAAYKYSKRGRITLLGTSR